MPEHGGKYCISTSNMIYSIAIVNTICGVVACIGGLIWWIQMRHEVLFGVGYVMFFMFAIVAYFYIAIYNMFLLCMNLYQISESCITLYNFNMFLVIVFSFIDGCIKLANGSVFFGTFFFTYSIIAGLSLSVTRTAVEELKKERQDLLDQFQAGRGDSERTQELETMTNYSEEQPKFQASIIIQKSEVIEEN